MSISVPLLTSLGICAASGALEGVLAGRGIKQRFAELQLPPYSPPLAVWSAIAVLYYGICGVVLYRLVAGWRDDQTHHWAIALLLTIMIINAIWNYTFFRMKNLKVSFLIGVPYAPAAIVLVWLLFQIDVIAARVFLPYLLYLIYAGWWGYKLWRINDAAA